MDVFVFSRLKLNLSCIYKDVYFKFFSVKTDYLYFQMACSQVKKKIANASFDALMYDFSGCFSCLIVKCI